MRPHNNKKPGRLLAAQTRQGTGTSKFLLSILDLIIVTEPPIVNNQPLTGGHDDPR